MTEPQQFHQVDLTGAHFERVQLNQARFRLVDLTGAWLRGVDLSGVSIDGDIDGLRINGVEIAPFVQAELTRRQPARSVLVRGRRPEPADYRQAWQQLADAWQASYDRVDALPVGTAEASVEGEWSFSQTLRHLVFATDAWLGAIRGRQTDFHPLALAFTDLADFVEDPSVLGLDDNAQPDYDEVLALRRERFAQVSDYLASVTPEQLDSTVGVPLWEGDAQFTARQCLWVIINEECEHHRYAERDLDQLTAALS